MIGTPTMHCELGESWDNNDSSIRPEMEINDSFMTPGWDEICIIKTTNHSLATTFPILTAIGYSNKQELIIFHTLCRYYYGKTQTQNNTDTVHRET